MFFDLKVSPLVKLNFWFENEGNVKKLHGFVQGK